MGIKEQTTIGSPEYSAMLHQAKNVRVFPVEQPQHKGSSDWQGAHSVNKLRSI
jgi:hypothetical protein